MPCDLVITRIGLPPRLVAPCRIRVEVDVTNAGADRAALPFDVLLTFPSGADETGRGPRYVETVKGGEGNWLMPGQTVTVPFMVSLPCRVQTQVRATADPSMVVPDNDRTQPSLTISAGPIDLLPWIQWSVRVGLENASRLATWNPPALCPGATVLVEAVFRNRGCVASGGFSVQLDVGGQSFAQAVGALGAGAQRAVVFDLKAPAAPRASLPFTITPNFSFPQCTPPGLSTSVAIPVLPGAAPRLSFAVDDQMVVPGQAPTITWRLDNDCDELGLVTAEVSFNGTLLYRSAPQSPRLRASVGESAVPIPLAAITMALAPAFWAFGTRPLDLTLTATGSPMPFTTQALLSVVPETGVFVFAFRPRPPAAWKRSYLVDGAFSNSSAFSAMTVTAVAFREHLSTDLTPAADKLVTLTAASFGTVARGTTTMPARGSFFSQNWVWINAVTFRPSIDTSRTYVYTCEYSFSDAFGNAYPAQVSPPLSVGVIVAPSKITEALVAMGSMIVFEAFALMGAGLLIYAATLPYPANLVPAIAGAICLTIAVSALGIAIWRKAVAEDPPLPDLDHHERVRLEPPPRAAFDPEVSRRPAFAALESLLELLRRVQSSDDAMQRIHCKMLGARVDGASEHLAIQARDFRAALGMFEASSPLLPDALAELESAIAADDLLTRPFQEVLRSWRDRGIPPEVEEKWREAGHPTDALELVGELARRLEPPPENLVDPLRQLVTSLGSMALGRRGWAREVLALADERTAPA